MMYCFRASVRVTKQLKIPNKEVVSSDEWFPDGHLITFITGATGQRVQQQPSSPCTTVSSKIRNKPLICYQLRIKQSDTILGIRKIYSY
jgi:hypothetical protein